MTRFLFIAVFICLLAPSMAEAAKIKTTIKPVIGRNGEFAFCVAEQKHPQNRYLSIGFSPKEKIYISTTIPNAGFKEGGKYDLRLILDEGFNRKVRAIATDSESLVIDMGRRKAFRKALIASNKMKLSANKTVIPFDLVNMMQVFTALKQCAENKGKAIAPTQQPPSSPSPKAGFPANLMELLKKAGFNDVMPLSMDDIPPAQRPADFIWETDSLLAGVKTRQAPKNKTLTDLIGLHIKGLRTKCKGQFKARIGKKERTSGRKIRRAIASCGPYEDKMGTPVSVALLFVLSNKGGFTVFTHEAEKGHEDKALGARDKLAKHLLNL